MSRQNADKRFSYTAQVVELHTPPQDTYGNVPLAYWIASSFVRSPSHLIPGLGCSVFLPLRRQSGVELDVTNL